MGRVASKAGRCRLTGTISGSTSWTLGRGTARSWCPPEGQGEPILFDCADAYVAERFVANHEISNLAAVVASHLDIDHVRGLLPFLRNHFDAGHTVRRLVVGLDRVPRERDKNLQALVEQALAWERDPPHHGFELHPPFRTSTPLPLAEGPDWAVELVLPWYGTVTGELAEGGSDPNHCSAVLRVTRGDRSILVGGDAPLGSWERLEPERRAAHTIRSPHHGGEIRHHGQEWQEFSDVYDAVSAEVGVVSVGTNNGHGHPLEAHVAAIRRGGGCRLLCTQLTPRCQEDPVALRASALEHAGLVEWSYRHLAAPGHPHRRPPKEVPCAGSVVVWLPTDGSVQVEPAEGGRHAELLLRVDRPMCGGAT